MISCFLWLAFATILIQIPNLMGIQANSSGSLGLYEDARISLVTLPVIYLATIGYTMFYGKGSEYFSYPAMSVYAKAIALIVAIFVQVVILKSRETNHFLSPDVI